MYLYIRPNLHSRISHKISILIRIRLVELDQQEFHILVLELNRCSSLTSSSLPMYYLESDGQLLQIVDGQNRQIQLTTSSISNSSRFGEGSGEYVGQSKVDDGLSPSPPPPAEVGIGIDISAGVTMEMDIDNTKCCSRLLLSVVSPFVLTLFVSVRPNNSSSCVVFVE